ncbi:MAG: DUF2243 domain-containing protein [Opitutus sp.]|nr:DUF2243 domain-containing protein [Opitutus sp.]
MIFRQPLFRAGLVLGLGLGGFVDGIVLHQILGWHHLICTTATCAPESIATLQRQNTQDGFFHAATWLLTVLGVVLLWRARDTPPGSTGGRVVFGGAVAGWGVFNFVEGLIDHQLLGIHHVKPDSSQWLIYDLLFLASGVVLVAVGWVLARSGLNTKAHKA